MVDLIAINGQGLGGAEKHIKLSLTESIECPFCHVAIDIMPLFFLDRDNNYVDVFLKCKRCKNSFIGYTQYNGNTGCYHIFKISKGNHKTRNFPSEINNLSPTFVKIYGESEFAEQENLNEICGVGYRKALEFLIKDYLIKKMPDQEDEIKKKFLGDCIKELIDNSRIKEIARRAAWLGNDETHYFRKWEDKDLEDLKKLIEITVHFISMEIEADKYMEEMEDDS